MMMMKNKNAHKTTLFLFNAAYESSNNNKEIYKLFLFDFYLFMYFLSSFLCTTKHHQ